MDPDGKKGERFMVFRLKKRESNLYSKFEILIRGPRHVPKNISVRLDPVD